jgi:hypothetical protein
MKIIKHRNLKQGESMKRLLLLFYSIILAPTIITASALNVTIHVYV